MRIALVFLISLSASTVNAVLPSVPLPSVFFRIPSNSMEPAIPRDSLVVAEQTTESLSRGEIVVATSPNGARLALRIVGVPGDRIQLDNGHAIVNGEVIRNDGSDIPAQRIGFARYPKWNETYVVPPDSLYLLADNRVEGTDSIEFGSFGLSTVRDRLLLWSHALEHPGRVQRIVAKALAPVRARLPLATEDGWTVRDVEVPDDTTLRVTYGVDSETFRTLSRPGVESLEAELLAGLCQNRLFKLATGFSIEYVIQGETSSTHVSLRQAECKRLEK